MGIAKVVIPAAGLGTRFLPYTKSVPKEMVPLLNKPAIQYVVEECIAADIKQFLFITSSAKHALEDYFDASPNLELFLEEVGKIERIASINKIMRNAHFSYIRQPEPLGLGHAIYMARHSIGKELFGVCLPDDIVASKTPAIEQLMRIAFQEKAHVIAVQEVPLNAVSAYGVINIRKQISPTQFQVGHVIEKPAQKDAPSNLAIVGRYVFSHKLFDAIESITPYASSEIQLTDAINSLISSNEKVIAYKLQGQRFDIGTPTGWLKANIHLALQDETYAPHIKPLLKNEGDLALMTYHRPNVFTEMAP